MLDAGQPWTARPSVARREADTPEEARTVSRGVGHCVTLTDADPGVASPVRPRSIHASALAQREAQRRQAERVAIDTAIQRLQGLGNTDDDKSPDILVRRVQQTACKNRPAQRYFDRQVVEQAERPEAPYDLQYTINHPQVAHEAEVDGVYLLVAGGPVADWDDASVFQAWKGPYKVEHGFRLTNQLFLCGPVFVKKPQRIVRLLCLLMVGCLVAGWIERQVRRALAERHEPIHGLMPEGRDNLKPTVPRILQAFAHYSLVLIKCADGSLVRRQCAQPNAVQQHILTILDLPSPAEWFGKRVLAQDL